MGQRNMYGAPFSNTRGPFRTILFNVFIVFNLNLNQQFGSLELSDVKCFRPVCDFCHDKSINARTATKFMQNKIDSNKVIISSKNSEDCWPVGILLQVPLYSSILLVNNLLK